MNEPLFNDSEKRIISGNLPTKLLTPVKYTRPKRYFLLADFPEAMESLQYEDEQVVLFMRVFTLVAEHTEAVDRLFESNLISDMLFALINTQYHPSDLPEEAYREASRLCPFITPLDKTLTGVCGFILMALMSMGMEGQSETEQADVLKTILCTYLTILRKIQEYEVYSTCTIDVSSIDLSSSLRQLLLDWEEKIDVILHTSVPYYESILNWTQESKYMVLLSEPERQGLLQLFRERLKIDKKVRDGLNFLEKEEEETFHEWELFLQLVHEISKREETIIQTIVDKAATAAEKLRAIETYEEEIKAFRNGTMGIHGKPREAERLLRTAEKRLGISQLARVNDGDGHEFTLDPSLLSITRKREDYNYFLIQYHHVRLSSSNTKVASSFLRLALSIITRNLLQNTELPSTDCSWIELVSSFYNVVYDFYEANKETIESMPYEHIQEPVVNSDEDTLAAIFFFTFILESNKQAKKQGEGFNKSLSEMLTKYEANDVSEEELCAFLVDAFSDYLQQMLNNEQGVKSNYQKIKKATEARQIVVSLDIIYLLCDALRIILQKQEAFCIDSETAEKIRWFYRRLSRMEDEINHKVYYSISWDEQDLHEVRQKQGVDAKSLTEYEQQEEKLRNDAFNSAYNDEVMQLLNQIELGSIEEAFNAKTKAQEKLSQLPDCAYKQQALVLFDSVSKEICRVLVQKDQRNADVFSGRKMQILTQLGAMGKILPDASIDSLTTAEYLYHQYVSIEYANRNFDYSCISCLYYQAFEEAYSALIWRDYANRLNHLNVNGHSFLELLRENDKAVRRYFFPKTPDWRNYFDYSSGKMSISCMYGPFIKLMKQVTEQRELTEFREYFAKKTGFSNDAEMQKDLLFMEECKRFIACIVESNDNRNNASHGGKRIGVEQCEEDKRAVINNIEAVRKDSIGLIQQLLFLLSWKGTPSVS